MTTKSKPAHVFKHDGVDYVLTEVFGSAVMHNEEEDTYCIDKVQMGKMIEHIRQQMGIAGFFQTRAEGLNKKLNDMRQAIRELESPKVAEEVGDYRDEIRRDKVYDKFLEYYRLHGDEINKLSMERLVPVYTAKRFGESSDCKVVQECIDAYEERIDELTKQCDEIYLRSKEMEEEHLNSMDDVIRERDDYKTRFENLISTHDSIQKCYEIITEKDHEIQKLQSQLAVLESHQKEYLKELYAYRHNVGLLDTDGHLRRNHAYQFVIDYIQGLDLKDFEELLSCVNKHCLVEDNIYAFQTLVDKMRKRIETLETNVANKENESLKMQEMELLNILRGYNACAIIIKKENGHDRWKAEYLTTKK